MTPYDLKREFCKTVFNAVNDQFTNPDLYPTGLRYFTKRDPHFFARIIDRNINKYSIQTMLIRLIGRFNKEILEICERDASKMNSTNSVCIYVKEGDLALVVILFDDRKRDKCFSMMPLTVLDGYEYQKCDYEIHLDEENNEKAVQKVA